MSGGNGPDVKEIIRLLRPHQWSKNLLLLLPPLLAHRLGDPNVAAAALLGAMVFCPVASAVYVVNDRLDLEADRLHPRKRNRPLARGTVPSRWVPPLAGSLAAAGLGLSLLLLPPAFTVLLSVYLAANALYSFGLKRIPVLDVLMLTLMYVLRLEAGGVAAGVAVSGWLLSFSLFVFLSLALGKRYQELLHSRETGHPDDTRVRGYRVGDLDMVGVLGAASGLLSVLVLALYVHSGEMAGLYGAPRLLWLLCPLVLYWLARFWILNARGQVGDDPVLFALRDRASHLVGLLLLAVVLAARHVHFPG